MAAANIQKGISLNTVLFLTSSGYTTAVEPSINRVLVILEPIILLTAKSALPLKLAIMFTINSGAEVPKDTMVRPITKSLILNFCAMAVLPSTSQSAPLISKRKPPIIKMSDKKKVMRLLYVLLINYIELNTFFIALLVGVHTIVA